jgi:hypothetical protein
MITLYTFQISIWLSAKEFNSDRGSFTFLGVELDKNLNWNEHIETICKKVGAAGQE